MHNKTWNKHRTPQWEKQYKGINNNNRTIALERTIAEATEEGVASIKLTDQIFTIEYAVVKTKML